MSARGSLPEKRSGLRFFEKLLGTPGSVPLPEQVRLRPRLSPLHRECYLFYCGDRIVHGQLVALRWDRASPVLIGANVTP